MKTEKGIKLYIFIVTFVTGILFTTWLIRLENASFWDTLLTLSVLGLNFYLINKNFKQLTKKY